MRKVPAISAEVVRSRIAYDPDTGAMVWMPRPGTLPLTLAWNKQWAGKPVRLVVCHSPGSKDYAIARLLGRWYGAHRLAWVCAYGMWPEHELDHINRDSLDNRLCNLRAATHADNQRNRGPMRNSKLGIKGVCYRAERLGRKKYYAQITHEYRVRYLGWFETPEEASAAYEKAARELHGAFYHKA